MASVTDDIISGKIQRNDLISNSPSYTGFGGNVNNAVFGPGGRASEVESWAGSMDGFGNGSYLSGGVGSGSGSGLGSGLSGGSSSGGSSGGGGTYSGSDATEYLKEMYAQNIAAQLANLQSTYQQNAADLQSQAEQIPEIYQSSRNETAAQNDLAKQSFNEYATAQGLNTGTSGQAALANSAVLQRNLAEISGKESDALAANALEQQKLAVAYRNAVAEAQASGNAELASALYQEYVRQDNLAQEAAAAAQAQKNWEAEFGFTQQQYSDSQTAAQQEYAYNLAMTMLQAGLMPDSSTLASAGISAADALAVQQAAAQPTTGTISSGRSSGSSKSSSNAASQNSVSQNELKNAEIDQASVLALGYGPITADYLYQLEQDGKIRSYLQNGKIKFELVGGSNTPSVKSSLLNTVF